MNLALRFGTIPQRAAAAEKIVKSKLPEGYTVKVETIGRTQVSGLGDHYYYTRNGPCVGSHAKGHEFGSDIIVNDQTGRAAIHVRIWSDSSMKGTGIFGLARPIIGYDTEAELALVKILATTLRREGKYIHGVEFRQGTDLLHVNTRIHLSAGC